MSFLQIAEPKYLPPGEVISILVPSKMDFSFFSVEILLDHEVLIHSQTVWATFALQAIAYDQHGCVFLGTSLFTDSELL